MSEAETGPIEPIQDGGEGLVDGPSPDGPSVEERASMVGWKEGGRLSAEEFLSKRDDDLGLARANNQTLEQKLHETNKTVSEMAKMQKAMMAKERQAGYDAAMEEIKAEKADAIANADPEKFAEAEQKEADLKEKQAQDSQSDQLEGQKRQVAEYVDGVKGKYPEVFETLQRAQAWREELAYQIQENGLSLEDATTRAVSAVAERFGFKQKPSTSLETGSATGSGNQDFNSMPPEAKKAYEKYASEGLFEGEEGKKEYAALYWEQE